MRVLWIAYGLVGNMSSIFTNKRKQGGNWIEMCFMHFHKAYPEAELYLVGIGGENREYYDAELSIHYVEFADVTKRRGNIVSKDTEKWDVLIKKYDPDIIQLFGTEFSNGKSIVEAAKINHIPVLIFIQGIMKGFKHYPLGQMRMSEICKYNNIIQRLKLIRYRSDFKQYLRQIKYEDFMVDNCDGIIIDNSWGVRYLGLKDNDERVCIQNLPVTTDFLTRKWNIENISRHTIFTIAGRTPYKGLHNLLKALNIVKKYYPDVMLRIPGNMDSKDIFSQPPYISYLQNYIVRNNLEKNVIFCGQLNSNQMANEILNCNVYVMPSCIENHSSSLREAMYLGAPCIASDVGSVNEFMQNAYNGFIYRYLEYEELAMLIVRLFDNDSLTSYIGGMAFDSIRIKYPQEEIGNQIKRIYENKMKALE